MKVHIALLDDESADGAVNKIVAESYCKDLIRLQNFSPIKLWIDVVKTVGMETRLRRGFKLVDLGNIEQRESEQDREHYDG